MLSTKNKRQCYTCVSKNRNNHQTLSVDHEQSFCNGQILLNTAKILKGNKKHLKQYQRNQNLKSRCSNKKNKNKSKSYFNSLAITADTTPRQQTILNSNLNLTMYHEKGHEFQIQQSKKPQAKSQTHFKQKMKMLTQNFCRKQFRKLHNNQQSKDKKNNRTILKQEIEDLSFRESAFSKELINYQNDQNRKPIPLKSNISKISTNSFQSINLQNRINQYMNVLIQKSEKDQLNILQTILTQRKDEQLEQIKLKEEKLLQKIRQRNAGFCKKIKMSNKNRLLKKTVNRNIEQNNRSKDKQSISPKYKSIDITWRDIIQENKTSQLPKNILKMHKSNQLSKQTFLNGSNLMNNNFLRSFIDKKRLQIQI